MSTFLKKIVVDCERMKYPNTGLYHYCLQLGNALLKEIDPTKEQLFFYTRASENGIFGNGANYIQQHSLHKFLMPNTSNYNVWHKTYQGTMYNPNSKPMKCLLTVHDINFMHDASKPLHKKNKYLQQLQKKIDKAAHIVAISQFVLDDLKKYTRIDKKPTSVIYNGCNIADIGICVLPQMLPTSKFIFTIGTVIEKKNFHVLPSLLVNNDWQLVISGNLDDASYHQKIITEAKKYNVFERLIFTGPISENDKQWYYQHCEALVFPSLAEGFGLPVIEAMHFGKPVILSTHTSLPEIGGTYAYYFQDFEPTTMQHTLINSLVHYQQQNPQVFIKDWANQFSWQAAAKQYLNLYRSL
jgi:glycosyltransferase involved in cell wall biosynthesis